MTLEQPTKDQAVISDLGIQIARLVVENAAQRADLAALQAVNADLEGQLEDASDRA